MKLLTRFFPIPEIDLLMKLLPTRSEEFPKSSTSFRDSDFTENLRAEMLTRALRCGQIGAMAQYFLA